MNATLAATIKALQVLQKNMPEEIEFEVCTSKRTDNKIGISISTRKKGYRFAFGHLVIAEFEQQQEVIDYFHQLDVVFEQEQFYPVRFENRQAIEQGRYDLKK